MRMLIADDHPVFRAGLRSLLETVPGAEIVGEAADGKEAVTASRQLRPDIVLMDIEMPELDGIAATRAIVTDSPRTAVLMVTIVDDDDSIRAALNVGARGYLLKGAGVEEITRAIEAVGSGNALFGTEVAARIISCLGSRAEQLSVPFPELTERERAVLSLVADGRGNAAIARELGLSLKTVRNYLSRVFAKLQVADRAEAAVCARRQGLGH